MTNTSPHAKSSATPVALVALSLLVLALISPVLPIVAAAPASAAGLSGCRTALNGTPWGRLAQRTWTPTNDRPGAGTVANPGVRSGAAFKARLVEAHGRDTAHARAVLTLQFSDGCQRTYQTSSFGAADRAYVDRAIAVHADPAPAESSYAFFQDPAFVTDAMVADGTMRSTSTRHFTIWYGTDTSAFSYRQVAASGRTWQQMLTVAGRAAEESYRLVRDVVGSPMPYARSSTKRKVNLYVCGTGLAFSRDDSGDCGASAGARSMFMSTPYLAEGSTTLIHEFAHVLQDFSGGFRGLDSSGKIWEGHAEWVTASITPAFNIWYWQNLENGPTWWTNRYGMYPLLQHLSSNARTRNLVWRAWTENARDANGNTTEEYLETIVRLGKAQGIYPKGWVSFADELGWYGARLAAEDFLSQQVYRDTKTYPQEANRYVGLTPGTTSGVYASPSRRPLWQYGTHLVPLRVTPGATTVGATVTGRRDLASAAWRYSVVARSKASTSGAVTYSTLGSAVRTARGQRVSVPVRAGYDYFLAVTATPTRYQRLGSRDDPEPAPTTYPYLVRLAGAQPTLSATAVCQGPYVGQGAANLNWNTNGHFSYDQRCP